MSRRFNDPIEQVNAWLHPIRLPAAVAQLVAIKATEVHEDYRQRMEAIQRETDAPSVRMDVDKLDPADRLIINRFNEVAEMYRIAKEAFEERFAFVSNGSAYFKLSEEEKRRAHNDRTERRQNLEKENAENLQRLREVALKLAKAHVASIRTKVPAELLGELEEVGAKKFLSPPSAEGTLAGERF